MLKEDAGRVCNRSGPRVMTVSRNLIINVSSFLGKPSLAAANHHGHVPPYAVNPGCNAFLICFAIKICFFVARKTLGGPGGTSCFFRG